MALPTNTGAFIHNGVNCTPNTIQTAQGVPYSNTSSGLSATNVQGAIDEVYKSTIPTVFGTQTEGTYALTGNINIPALYDGLTINYYLPYSMAGTGPATLNLTLSNGTTTGAKSIYLRSGYLLGEQYFSGDTIQMTFYSAGSITKNGTPTTIDMWICQGETGMVRHTNLSNSANFEYPLLMGTPTPLAAYSIAGKSYGNLSYNPSTTTLTATKFAGDISACTGLSGTSVSYDSSTNVTTAITNVSDRVSVLERNKNTSGSIDVSSYTNTNPYIVPQDGYVVISSETSSSGVIRVVVQFSNGTTGPYMYMNVTGNYQIQNTFVKKGMRVWILANTATASTIRYFPLES